LISSQYSSKEGIDDLVTKIFDIIFTSFHQDNKTIC
jgi:hypothetical protein